MKKLYALLFLILIVGFSVSAQIDGDYRTIGHGNWDSAKWEKWIADEEDDEDGGDWDDNGESNYTAPTTIPSGNTFTIRHIIRVRHTTFGSAHVLDITNNGTLVINSGKKLEIGRENYDFYYGSLSGSGTITNNGHLKIFAGTVTINSGKTLSGSVTTLGGDDGDATLIINGIIKHESGYTHAFAASTTTIYGTYDYAINDGDLASNITWESASILKLTGVTNAWPTFQTDTYNDIEVACSGLTTNMEMPKTIGTKFTNVNISNTGSYAITTDAGDLTTISGNLTIGASGKLIIGATDKLTVTGTMTNDATIADLVINSSATRSGSLITSSSLSGTYNQYVSDDVWHLVGIPVAKGTGATLGDFNPASGDGYMRAYETGNSDWGVYLTTLTDQLNVGQGYEYWTTVNHTVSVTGAFNTGNVSLTMSSAGNQYNLLANPYPCGLDWESVADKTHALSQSIYYYASTAGTNGYAVYSAATSSGTYGATRYIPPFQGFFVEQKDATDMDFTNAAKAHPDHGLWKQSTEEGINNRIRIKVEEMVGGEALWAETVIVYVDEATNGYDDMIDTKMLENAYVVSPEIYSIADGENITINGFGTYPAVIPLSLDIIDAGIATISVTELSDMQNGIDIKIEDRETGEFYTADDNLAISFTVEPGTIADRFFVHYNSTVGVEDIETEANTTIYASRNTVYINSDNAQAYDIQIINMMGQEVYTGRSNAQGLYSISLNEPTAYYVVRVISSNETVTQKVFIEN